MKHWYQQPHQLLSPYIRTVLILEGWSVADLDELPLVTNGMPALFYKCEKDKEGKEKIIQLTLFGKSVPGENCTISNDTTVIAYFFKPFALATIFNVAASKLNNKPIEY